MGFQGRIQAPTESTGHVPVALQDQHTEMVVSPLHVELNSGTLLAAPTVVDATTISFSSGHGASAGNSVCIKEGTHFYIGVILSIPADVATMDTPLDYAFTTSAAVCIGDPNLNKNGSLAVPILAHISPPAGTVWDVTRLHVRMVDDAVMDAGTFGGISALTNGVVLRKTDGVAKNIGNVKTNGDLAALASNYEFDLKPPSGKYGFTSNHVFGGQEHIGVVMRLDGSTSDEMQVIIQDNLTGVEKLQIILIGHVVQN